VILIKVQAADDANGRCLSVPDNCVSEAVAFSSLWIALLIVFGLLPISSANCLDASLTNFAAQDTIRPRRPDVNVRARRLFAFQMSKYNPVVIAISRFQIDMLSGLRGRYRGRLLQLLKSGNSPG
jgi:hypothetical protein